MDALDGWVGNLPQGLQCASVENGNQRKTGGALARVEEISIAGKHQALGAEGQWGRDLVERGVEKKKLSGTGGDELHSEAAAVGICSYERNGSRAEGVRASEQRTVRVKNR